MSFTKIVLSGGAKKGIIQLGALHYYVQRGKLDFTKVNEFCGTSVGSVNCLLLSIGWSPLELFGEIYSRDNMFDMVKDNSFTNMWVKHGFVSIDSIMGYVEILIKKKIGFVPTFAELYKLTGKKLTVCASNLTDTKPEYFNHITHPDMCCLQAVKLSSNIQGIFHRIYYDGKEYTDGGLCDNFPVKYIDDGVSKILGVATVNDMRKSSYAIKLTILPVLANTQRSCDLCGKNVTLINVRHDSQYDFSMIPTSKEKMSLFQDGYSAAEIEDEAILLYIWIDDFGL